MAVNYVSSDSLAKEVVEEIRRIGRQAILAQGDVADDAAYWRKVLAINLDGPFPRATGPPPEAIRGRSVRLTAPEPLTAPYAKEVRSPIGS